MLLPKNNPNEDLETIARNKFCALFNPSLFELRQELQRDKGIDYIIELKQDNSYTNFRFAVQLKSTASAQVNADQSISFPVEMSNLNYLLNFGMPAYYVLYDHQADKFYFEQLNEVNFSLVQKYLSREKFPNHFTIRFAKLLGQTEIKEIYDEILSNGLLLRTLNEHRGLYSALNKKNPGIVIDSNNGVYSTENNIEFIERYGLALMNRGEHKRIIEIEQRTIRSTKLSPMFNLVCGLAYFQQASLLKAVDFLKEASNESESFDPSTRMNLAYTFLQAKHLLGLITQEEFHKEANILVQAEGLGSYIELEKAYGAFYDSEGDKEAQKILKNKILSFIDAEPGNHPLRIRTYSIMLAIEEKELAANLTKHFIMLCGRGMDLLQTNIYKSWKEVEKIHDKRLETLVKFSLVTQYFLAMSNVLMQDAEWCFQKLYIMFVLKNWSNKSLSVEGKPDEVELKDLARQAERIDMTISGYAIQEHREHIAYALNLKYEILAFAGRAEDAANVASQILSMIDTYNMNGLKSKYQWMIEGKSRYKYFLDSFSAHMNNIYRVAKNSGVEKNLAEPVPESMLHDADPINIQWLEGGFFQMVFPSIKGGGIS